MTRLLLDIQSPVQNNGNFFRVSGGLVHIEDGAYQYGGAFIAR